MKDSIEDIIESIKNENNPIELRKNWLILAEEKLEKLKKDIQVLKSKLK